MPRTSARRLAGRTADRTAAGAVFPRRLHPAGGGGRNRVPEQGSGLRHLAPGRGRSTEHDRRRSAPSRRRDRFHCRASYLGPDTWGQNLQHHPHVHCLVPGGGLSPDGRRWVSCRPGFFLAVRVLSRLFRRLFLEKLRAAFDAGRLAFFGALAGLAAAPIFARRLSKLRRAEWVVYAKRPFAGPAAVLTYLSRYTHRVAIANSRLIDMTGEQ